jgi:hypothetical protein
MAEKVEPSADSCSADNGDLFDGLRVIAYRPGDDGRVVTTSEAGRQPVNTANRKAWQEIEEKIARSVERVRTGRVSCLHYYMTAHLMDVGLLAAYTHLFRWQVRLHLRPWVFRRLSETTLRRYARLFNVEVEILRQGRLLPRCRTEAAGD